MRFEQYVVCDKTQYISAYHYILADCAVGGKTAKRAKVRHHCICVAVIRCGVREKAKVTAGNPFAINSLRCHYVKNLVCVCV